MSNYDLAVKGLDFLARLRQPGPQAQPLAMSPSETAEYLNLSLQDVQDLFWKLTQFGYIQEVVPPASHEPMYRLTPAGLQQTVNGQERGYGRLSYDLAPPMAFQQTVHGTANTQVDSNNTMNVQHNAAPDPAGVLELLSALRQTLATLPADEQDEAATTLKHAEQAVQGGAWQKLNRYVPTLIDLGTKSAEFGIKAHEFPKAVGLA